MRRSLLKILGFTLSLMVVPAFAVNLVVSGCGKTYETAVALPARVIFA